MENLMIEKSDELLYEFFSKLGKEELFSIGLMGGWAVHYTLKIKDVVHVGSRDIDIFFDPAKIKPKTVAEKLEKLGFQKHSTFRWAKYFDTETKKELDPEKSRTHPIPFTSTIYFDVATPTKLEHTMPEPLLKKVFGKEKEFVKILDIHVMVPSHHVLIEMKLKSVLERNDAFKRTKDVADLYALLENTPALWVVRNGENVSPCHPIPARRHAGMGRGRELNAFSKASIR